MNPLKTIILSAAAFLVTSVSCNSELDKAITDIKNGASRVILVHTQIGDSEVKALAAALKGSQLIDLSLAHNYAKIGAEGAKALAEALKDSQLAWLDLDGNQIGDSGAKALAAALKDSQLTRLYLGSNQIGAEGAMALAEALKDSQLTWLHLGGNQIGDKGAIALAEALKDSQLTDLSLTYNQIGDSGAKSLAGAFKDSQLIDLFLGGNQIGAYLMENLNQQERALQSKHKTYGNWIFSHVSSKIIFSFLILIARNYELVMKAAKEHNVAKIKDLMSLPADKFRLVGKGRQFVAKVLLTQGKVLLTQGKSEAAQVKSEVTVPDSAASYIQPLISIALASLFAIFLILFESREIVEQNLLDHATPTIPN